MQSERGKMTIEFLSVNVLNDILDLLDGKSLLNLSLTSKFWTEIIFDLDERASKRWKRLVALEIGETKLTLHQKFVESEGFQSQFESQITSFWKSIFLQSNRLESFQWWEEGREMLNKSLSDSRKDPDSNEDKNEPNRRKSSKKGSEIMDRFARSGHTATSLGGLIVIIGGLSNEGTALSDVVIVHVKDMKVQWPEVDYDEGCPKFTGRLRHSSSLCRVKGSEERTILVIGGHNLSDQFSSNEIFQLKICDGGRKVKWSLLKCTGDYPSPRYHHSAVPFNDRQKLILFGGGPSVYDYILPNGEVSNQESKIVIVYLLDLHTFHWTKILTGGDHPGVRTLHMACLHRINSEEERMVVVGGFKRGVLAPVPMVPSILNLKTFTWETPPQENYCSHLPSPRHRGSCTLINKDKWLIYGGATLGTTQYLCDAHILDLKSLIWSEVEIFGTPRKSPTAGHTMAGNVVIGGSKVGSRGILPVARMDPLIFGNWTDTED